MTSSTATALLVEKPARDLLGGFCVLSGYLDKAKANAESIKVEKDWQLASLF